MALPTKEKTWQFTLNQTIPIADTPLIQSQKILWAIKEAMKGFASNPWVVVSSSNSSSAGVGDNWTTFANVVFNSGNHSWIVLQQDGIATGFQLLIDNNSAAIGYPSNFYVSPSAGFTGGNISTRPTATDELYLYGANRLWGGTNVYPGGSVSVLQSTDGECTRVVILGSNTDRGMWILDRLKNPIADMVAQDWVVGIYSTNATTTPCMETADWIGASQLQVWRNSMLCSAMMTLEGQGSDTLTGYWTGPDEVTGDYLIFPPGVFVTTPGARGRVAEIYDLWWGSEVFGPGVVLYPNAGTKLFSQFHDVILPWDGVSTPIWST